MTVLITIGSILVYLIGYLVVARKTVAFSYERERLKYPKEYGIACTESSWNYHKRAYDKIKHEAQPELDRPQGDDLLAGFGFGFVWPIAALFLIVASTKPKSMVQRQRDLALAKERKELEAIVKELEGKIS